ncbi:putative prefoldin subunit protein [Lasiodiplodia theobromae]|uniref:Putative prefoldin subunit 5 n=1 Tax=Lasiodiplodia theobromae TaxID=45133 RepID=A0A5N5DHV3_9PEZI|nr:Prefoldin subunit [Lasiodiplodia theobromae]KAB2577456.1 putative prefoldin subunit 5 [Lasiodiplodia theobromae]KAF4540387.1 Prefoldin subunit [Lasiodiplodia theobromae]KAF9640415.1 putative prefoldin subunit protein [Lasiodiplodia theobromae]
MASSSDKGGQMVDLATLSLPQLSQLKKQLDTELEHLTSSFQSLRSAQTRFKDCLKSINTGLQSGSTEKPILVPLTSSLYVTGTLADVKNVLVDVGTGFYVEKSTDDAKEFYDRKIKDLEKNLKDLEAIVTGKSNNLRVIEDVLRQKVLAQQQGQAAGAAQTAAAAS